jgi:diaminopimelate epimerase
MSVFNSDGYMGANCGNGLRCVALYLHKTRKLGYSFKIATDSGDKQAELTQREDKEWMVQINLGSPAPITEVLYDLPNHPISTRYLKDSRIYLCSIGNKHYVIFLGLEDY